MTLLYLMGEPPSKRMGKTALQMVHRPHQKVIQFDTEIFKKPNDMKVFNGEIPDT